MTQQADKEFAKHVDQLKLEIEAITRQHSPRCQIPALANALANAWWVQTGTLSGLATWMEEQIRVIHEAIRSGQVRVEKP